jgi:hypothetical protein
MRNPLHGYSPWVQLLILAAVLPVVIGLAVLGFAWPAGRIAPRDLPVGIVGATPSSQVAVEHLAAAEPGAFDFRLFPTSAAAVTAIRDRDVYGSLEISGSGVTVLEAPAASPAVAQLLSTVGQSLATSAPAGSAGLAPAVTVVDVVPNPSGDPRGVVFSASLLPLTICSLILAVVLVLAVRIRPAWRQVVGLVVLAAVSAAAAFLIAQTFLGALPGEHWATWAGLAMTILAIEAATAGLIALIGPPGLVVSAALFVFLGNPFSGVTSAPDLLPVGVHHLGQWLPPGAGASLLRSTAYFSGHGVSAPLTTLALWVLFGLAAVVVGHHGSPKFAAYRAQLLERVELTPSVPGRG